MVMVRSFIITGLACLLFTPCEAATCAFKAGPKIAATEQMVVLAEGDSITAGVGSSSGDRSYVLLAAPLLRQPVRLVNKAVSQSVLGWPGANAPTNSLYARRVDDNAAVPKDKNGHVYVLTILIGRNDLVGYYGGLDQYFAMLRDYTTSMREAGWDRIVLGTLLPSTWAPFDAERDAFNARVQAPCWANEHGIDAIADFASVPEIGSSESASDRHYFADGTHPTDAGYAAMAPAYAAAINALWE